MSSGWGNTNQEICNILRRCRSVRHLYFMSNKRPEERKEDLQRKAGMLELERKEEDTDVKEEVTV